MRFRRQTILVQGFVSNFRLEIHYKQLVAIENRKFPSYE